MVTVSTAQSTAPTVFPLAQCGSGTGDLLTLGCLATGFTPASVTFKWTDPNSNAIDSLQYPAVQTGGNYMAVSQVKVNKQDWDAMKTFTCAVEHSAGNAEREITRILPPTKKPDYLQAPSLFIMTPSKEENQTASFACVARDFSPEQPHTIRWIRKGKGITGAPLYEFSTITEKGKAGDNPLYSATSYLQVKESEWIDQNAEFTCIFEHITGNLTKSVKYSSPDGPSACSGVKIEIIPPTVEDLFLHNEDKTVELACHVREDENSPGFLNITWKDEDDKPLASVRDKSREAEHLFIDKLRIPYQEWVNQAEFTCEVEHTSFFGSPEMKTYKRAAMYPQAECLILTDCPCSSTFETDGDGMGTAITFIFLFLITLLYSIGATVIKRLHDAFHNPPGVSSACSATASVQRVVQPTITLHPVWEDREGEVRVSLLCRLSGYYPDNLNVQWLRDEQVVQVSPTQRKLHCGLEENATISLDSRLELNMTDWLQGSSFQCKATHNATVLDKTTSICLGRVSPPPFVVLETPTFRTVMTQSDVIATCVVHTPYEASVSWLLDGTVAEGKAASAVSSATQGLGSNLTLSSQKWKTLSNITCRAEHPCFKSSERTASLTGPSVKDPSVLIRRSLPDVLTGDSAVLECDVTQLSSSDLYVTFQADGEDFDQKQYVAMAPSKDLQSLTRRVLVPAPQQKKDSTFTCKVTQGISKSWVSSSTGKIFGDPSIELLLVPREALGPGDQKLVCSGLGFNPKIRWLSGSEDMSAPAPEVMIREDGRVLVTSHITIPQDKWNQGSEFTCEVKDSQKTVNRSISMCAETPASSQAAWMYLQGPPLHRLWTDAQVPITCLLVGSTLVDFSVRWRMDGVHTSQNVSDEKLDHGNGTETVVSILTIPAKTWHAHAQVSCEAKHPCSSHGHQRNISKTRDPKPPTVQTVRASDVDLSGSGDAALLCLVTGFYPGDVTVHWERNGSKLASSLYTSSPPVQHEESATYSLSSRLTIPRSQQGQEATYSCVVQHESSRAPIRSFITSASPAPPTADLLQGSGKLVCLAFGFSPAAVNITWLVDGVAELRNHSTSAPYRGPGGRFSVHSHLHLPAQDWQPGVVYSCRVTHASRTVVLNISKPEILEEGVYFDENEEEPIMQDMTEEHWRMACIFLILFFVSLLYGISVTLVKTK